MVFGSLLKYRNNNKYSFCCHCRLDVFSSVITTTLPPGGFSSFGSRAGPTCTPSRPECGQLQAYKYINIYIFKYNHKHKKRIMGTVLSPVFRFSARHYLAFNNIPKSPHDIYLKLSVVRCNDIFMGKYRGIWEVMKKWKETGEPGELEDKSITCRTSKRNCPANDTLKKRKMQQIRNFKCKQ